jgi:putative DNA-invertase from lambdoid prophage Rac
MPTDTVYISDRANGQKTMARTFAYCRVSTAKQTTKNQIREIEATGFHVDRKRIIAETVSGSSAIEQRPGFLKLLDRLEHDNVLIVTKLDRLGRNAIDVATTVAKLEAMGVRVHCLALGGVDLTSAAGKMTMHVINAVAQFEKELLVERILAGQERARAAGSVFGRKPTFDETERPAVLQRLADGASVSAVAREFGTSRQTVLRVRDGAQEAA